MARGKSNHVEANVDAVTKVERDELAELVVKTLNKARTDGIKSAGFLTDLEDPSTVTDWVSTGSSLLDLAISNRKNGGLPSGRIVELNGLEGTGKSLMVAHILANAQKAGGVAAIIDTENAAAPLFWEAVGVNLNDLIYDQLYTVEEIFSSIETIIGTIRKSDKKRLVVICVDSLAAASCSSEMESQHGKDGYNTSKAIIISKALRKITGLIGRERILVVFTNQLRMNLNAVKFGDKWVVPGGKAMGFSASVRVRLANTGQIKRDGKIIGNICKAVVTKNRMGPPKRTAQFEIHFDSGIQDLKSWLDFLKDNGMARKVSGEEKYSIKLAADTVKVSPSDFVEKINSDVAFKDEIYNMIADQYIMKYKDANSQIIEDIEVDDTSDED